MEPRFTVLVHAVRRLVLVLAGTCVAGGVTADARAGCACGSVADGSRAGAAGLVREWIAQVPFDSSAWRLAHVVTDGELVIVQAGDGSVHAIRAPETPGDGTVAWSRTPPATAGQSWPPTASPRLVLVTGEKSVQALDRDTGAVVWERGSGALTAGAAVQSGDWVYVPLETGRILRLPADPFGSGDAEPRAGLGLDADDPVGPRAVEQRFLPEGRDALVIDAEGRLDGAAVPFGGGLVWGTDRGLVVLEPTPSRWIRHRFPETTATAERMAFVGTPVVHGDGILVVTADGVLARIVLNAPNHSGLWAAWSSPLPDRPTSGPIVHDDTVLVSLGPSGSAAFAVADGSERWRSDVVGTVVAATAGRAWVRDETGRLTALDLASGVRRGSWDVGCFTLPVVTATTGRIVMASPSGRVVSLAPLARATERRPVTVAPPADEPGTAGPGATPP